MKKITKKQKIKYAGYALVTSLTIVGDAIALAALMTQRQTNGLGDIPYALGSSTIGVGGMYLAMVCFEGVNNLVDGLDEV